MDNKNINKNNINNNNDISFLINLLSSGKNPQDIVKNLISKNSQLGAVYSQAQQSGMSMKDFAMQYAKQNNIDIQQYIDMMSKTGIKF